MFDCTRDGATGVRCVGRCMCVCVCGRGGRGGGKEGDGGGVSRAVDLTENETL